MPIENNNAKGKGKVDIDQTRKEMNETWKKNEEDGNNGTNGIEVT